MCVVDGLHIPASNYWYCLKGLWGAGVIDLALPQMDMVGQNNPPALSLWYGLVQLQCLLGDFRPGMPKSIPKQKGGAVFIFARI